MKHQREKLPVIEIEDTIEADKLKEIFGTVALGRNNWKTISTIDGATATGYMYSLAETAKRNGANPYYYYKYLLEKSGALLEEHKENSSSELEYLDPMMPWSAEYRAYEKAEMQREHDILSQLLANVNTKNT